jgi:hypothetical protein
MVASRALQAIAAISLAGVLCSGFLTYREFAGGPASCSAIGAPGSILGYPPCLYGLVMYALVFGLALAGLRAAGQPRH